MFNFIKRKLHNWLSTDIDDSWGVSAKNVDISSQYLFNVKVYNAVGGIIFEFIREDKKTDDYIQKLYVITDDTDVSQELAKFISIEILKI